jgi:enoyl-CoA hydratase/carnithine racemase
MTQLQEYATRYRHVHFERRDGVLAVRFHTDDGPLVWSPAAHRELGDAFADIGGDPANKVVVMTGTGDSFIDSMDVEAFVGQDGGWDVIWWEGKRLLANLLAIDVPVIGVINGPASVHAEIGVLSDIVLAAETASFCDGPHFASGTVPGDGVHIVWPQLLGPNRGRYFLLTTQVIDAREARELGLVNEVLPSDQLVDRAHELARHLAAKPLPVLRYTREALTYDLRKRLLEGLSHGLALEGCGAFAR